MKDEPGKQGRHSIRLRGYDYAAAGGYFVTIVGLGWKCVFGKIVKGEMRLNTLGKIVKECWDEIPIHFPYTSIDAFVIMPNHIHGIIVIHDSSFFVVGAQHAAPLQNPISLNVKPGSLGAIVRSFKSAVTYRAHRELNMTNIWQRNYYEHIIRNDQDYENITRYVISNPMNWGEDDENPRNIAKRGI